MGLIRAALNAGGSVLADQWKEYFQVDSMSNEQLVVKAHRQTAKGNNKGGDDIISNGSVVAVGDGQVALIVEDGKIVEFCAEPGRFIWDESSPPCSAAASSRGLRTPLKSSASGSPSAAIAPKLSESTSSIPRR